MGSLFFQFGSTMYSDVTCPKYNIRSCKTKSLPSCYRNSSNRIRSKRPSLSMYSSHMQSPSYINSYDYYPYQISDYYVYQYQPYQLYTTASSTRTLGDNHANQHANYNPNTRTGNYYTCNNNNEPIYYDYLSPNSLRCKNRSNEFINLSNTNLSIHENCFGDI